MFSVRGRLEIGQGSLLGTKLRTLGSFFPARGEKGASPETRGGVFPELPAPALGHDSAGFDYFCSDHHHRHVVAAIIRHLAKGCRFLLVTGPPSADGEFIARFLDEENIGGYRSTLLGCHPGMDFRNLASAYGRRLGLGAEGDSGGLLWTLLSHLMRELRNGIKRVLVLERADELDALTFNELLRFTQLDTPRLMPVVLLASPTLVERLETPSLAFLRAAIGGSIALQWLAPEEVGAFIQYQLKTTPEAPLFPPETIVAIAEAAHGDPAIVNRLAREVVSSAKPASNEVSSPGVPESAGADGEAAKGAPPLVDGAAAQAFAGRTGDTRSPSTDSSSAIGASALGDRITIDGLGRQDQEMVQTPARTAAPAVEPSDTERLRSERVETVRTARRLAPTDEFPGTGLAKVSFQPRRGRFRLPLSAVVAGYFLVSMLAGGALLYHLLGGSPHETASPAAAVVIATVQARAPEPVAAAPIPAVPTSDASVSAGAPAAAFAFAPMSPAEPASEAVASQSPELQTVGEPAPAAEPAAATSPVIASLPGAAEIGSAGKDAIPAAAAPPGPFVPVPGVEPANTVSEIQVIPTAPAVSASPMTLPDPVPPAPAPRMTPPPAPASRATEAMAPAGEISANIEPASALTAAEPPPIAAPAGNARPTTMPEPAPPAPAARTMPPAAPSSNATDRTAPSNEIVATVESARPPRSVELPPSADVAAMVRRGNQLLAVGDIISARRFFERAAAAGDAAAACGVGKSFDPLFLRQMGARGLSGDAATAIVWYRKAAEAGNREAQEWLRRLSGGRRE